MKKKTTLKKRIVNRDRHGNLILRTPEEMAAAFNLPEEFAIELRFRRPLINKIIEIIKKDEITHAVIAKRVGTSRSRITALINNTGTGASIDLMIRVLNALGYQAEFKVKKIAS